MVDTSRPDTFHQAFGSPAVPAAPMHFEDAWLERLMSTRIARIGAGWYLGKMFYLFGEGLERLESCVKAWSFLLPPALTYWRIIGVNAYGAILLLDIEGAKGTLSPVGMLDPLTVDYLEHSHLNLFSLLGDWLPNRKLSRFLDISVYQEFLKTSRRLLDDDEILGIQTALPLGGAMTLDNFLPMNILDYYTATAAVYARAHEEVHRKQ